MYKPNATIQNSRIKVYNQDVIKDSQKTFVTDSITAADSTLTVQNIAGVSTGDYLILGKIGSEKTEIVRVSTSVSPSGTTITLEAGSLPSYNHPTDTAIYVTNYNQLEFSRATTSGGTKTVLATIDITVDQMYTVYNDTTNSTGYFYARWKNESDSVFSEYSDEQSYSNTEQNKISNLIDRILRIAHTKVSREDAMDFIKDGLTRIYESREKWSFEESSRDRTNYYATGTEEFTIPTDLKENKSQYIEWIGPETRDPLKFIDIREFNEKQNGLARTTLNGDVLNGATTITLTDSSRFASAGTGYIGSDEFTWTGKNSTTHTLTGVSGIEAHSDGDIVFQDSALGTPMYWTIFGGVGRITPAPNTTASGRSLIIEYFKDVSDFDSENDTIPIPFWSLLVDYALMRIAERNNEFTTADRYQARFERMLMARVGKEKVNEVKQIQFNGKYVGRRRNNQSTYND